MSPAAPPFMFASGEVAERGPDVVAVVGVVVVVLVAMLLFTELTPLIPKPLWVGVGKEDDGSVKVEATNEG